MNDLIAVQPDKHNYLGIASVTLAAVSVILFGVTGYWLNGIHQQLESIGAHDASAGDVIGFFICMFCLLLIFLGFLLGLIGCFQKGRKKLFAILGLLINGAQLVAVGIYLAIFLGFL